VSDGVLPDLLVFSVVVDDLLPVGDVVDSVFFVVVSSEQPTTQLRPSTAMAE
jgi:hypothetical protein